MIKKALLVGINAYPDAPLQGCLNDVSQMYDLLTGSFGFQPANIRCLRDSEATHAGIVAGLNWLAAKDPGSDQSDVRVFHYSGHGTFQADDNGDEPDGRDEALVPFDYATAGFIVDDKLGKLYDLFPAGSNLTLLMDCCHSGSIQRGERDRFLPVPPEEWQRIDQAKEKYEADRMVFLENKLKEVRDMSDAELSVRIRGLMSLFDRQRKRFGDVTNRENNLLVSGCKDIQTSADAFIDGKYHGAFTYYFVDAIKKLGSHASYESVIAQTGKNLYQNEYLQVPQLSGKKPNKQISIFSSFPQK